MINNTATETTTEDSNQKYLAMAGPHPVGLSFLLELSPKAQACVIEMMNTYSYKDCVTRLSRPHPEGFNILVSTATLSRFKKEVTFNKLLESAADTVETASRLGNSLPDEANLPDLSIRILEQRLFQLLLDPETPMWKIREQGPPWLRSNQPQNRRNLEILKYCNNETPPIF